MNSHDVAPYVGAWIETIIIIIIGLIVKSHPTWVRGLKLNMLNDNGASSPSHPTWVRGLKPYYQHHVILNVSRTLRGCVD